SLGILFGVASVITMLAIGKGAEQEILEQMRVLGSNNVVITPLIEQTEGNVEDRLTREVKKFSPGLTYADAQSLARAIPVVEGSSAEIVLNTSLTREGWRRSGKVVGVDTTYFRLTNLELGSGRWFTPMEVEQGRPVTIIGYGVRSRFFTTEDPLGKQLKVGSTWVTVVGVLQDRRFDEQVFARLGIRDANMDVYVPVHTMLLRFRNRALVTKRDMEAQARDARNDTQEGEEPTEEQRAEQTNLHQLDRIIVRVTESRWVPTVAEIAQRLLARRHNTVVDFEVTVPELLLRQERRTKTIFNIVLGAIASISLIVGGIGIMNIMLASVLERTREIGVRRAVGATQRDVLSQFLSEAVLISVVGGIAGILVGGGLSTAIERFAGIQTIISPMSIAVAFGVSCSVGLVFGIVPAYRAARRDPVICLRYE
ncbi:MAG: ABC transporter permease, partial [Gemmatimonadota bacterium]|nr:ABC transporter permease [Gemmatimonadota bacterium]